MQCFSWVREMGGDALLLVLSGIGLAFLGHIGYWRQAEMGMAVSGWLPVLCTCVGGLAAVRAWLAARE